MFFALIGTEVFAQQSDREAEQALREAEEQQRAAEIQMREAEERLAEAARQIADLSRKHLPAIVDIERLHLGGRLVLGITIGSEDDDGPVEGVTVRGVSPGAAADEAGLRSGDIITAVNGESLTADSDELANARLIEFMSGVEEGDVLDVEYLREGKQAKAEVRPREMSPLAFAFNPGHRNFSVGVAPHGPERDFHRFSWLSDGSGWGHMEMVSLTDRLGKYFGTDKGLLVVRAPDDEALKLEDGDVIQSIDGREPKSVSHAMRILGSYQSGEELELQIMRDRKRQTLKIEMPDNRRSFVPRFAPRVDSDVVIAPKVRVVKKERT
jgi:C-terminal processing protease CtpA/Prc